MGSIIPASFGTAEIVYESTETFNFFHIGGSVTSRSEKTLFGSVFWPLPEKIKPRYAISFAANVHFEGLSLRRRSRNRWRTVLIEVLLKISAHNYHDVNVW